MPDRIEKLRGAAARVPAADMKTAQGMVELRDGTTLSHVELAPVAATKDPVNGVTLRDPSTWRLGPGEL